ncbi:MAG: MFS transporter [Alcanivorax sp.]|nr:MFS transporter [Alcanivorax sp.]MAY09353.1 MFS transporter [Alcanivorax sp.]HCE38444.1 MFS transporter [Alcanivorax sp.]|tara:strand:- start:26578 stop:27792 length:1215 start_codon:yes stop_codon:yes gene_type:complete
MSLVTPPPHRPNALIMVTGGILTALVAIVFARLAYGVILPPMREDLGLSYRQAGNLGTVTALGYLLFVLVGGVAAGRWGARNAVALGLFILTFGFAGLAVAADYRWILGLMGLLGLGTAFCFAPMVSLLATWYPERRGLVIGCMGAGVGAGLFGTGLLVPWLSDAFGDHGWRFAWGLFAAFSAVAVALVLIAVRDPDPLGSDDPQRPAPADKWRIYRHPRVITMATVYGVIGMVYIIQSIFMVSYVVEAGHGDDVAGWLMAMSGLLSVASGPLWGSLSDIWGRGNALTLATAVVTLAMGLPLLDQGLPVFFAHFLLMGCAVNGVFTMIQAASTDQVAPRFIPIAFSYVTVFFATGQFLGPAIAGALIEFSGGFHLAVGFTCAALLGALLLTLRIRRFPRDLAVG